MERKSSGHIRITAVSQCILQPLMPATPVTSPSMDVEGMGPISPMASASRAILVPQAPERDDILSLVHYGL